MENAKQNAQIKINEAQHAHLAMREAEDNVTRLKNHAKYLRSQSDDLEAQIVSMGNEKNQQQQYQQHQQHHHQVAAGAAQSGYGGMTTIDFSDQLSKASDVSFGTSRASAVPQYCGYPGALAQPVDDASGLMGGSSGYGGGVMGGYASSAGFADGSAYGSSIQGGTSISGSTSNNVQGGGSITQLQTGNTSDAASRSVSSELLYPPIDTPQNGGGSVAGGASISGSTYAGSVHNVQGGTVNDAASRGVVSDSINPQADNMNVFGGSIAGGASVSGSTYTGSVQNVQGDYVNDAASRSIVSESINPQVDNLSNVFGGSVTGGASISGSTYAGSVTNVQGEYVNDAASRSMVSENVNQSADNMSNVFGGSVAGSASISGSTYAGSVNNMQGEYVNDAVPRSMVSESMNPSTENTNNPSYPSSSLTTMQDGYTSDGANGNITSENVYAMPGNPSSEVVHQTFGATATASNETEYTNNMTISNNNNMQQTMSVGASNMQGFSRDDTQQQQTPNVNQGPFSDFSALLDANNNQDFDGIPSPEKPAEKKRSDSGESFGFTMVHKEGEETAAAETHQQLSVPVACETTDISPNIETHQDITLSQETSNPSNSKPLNVNNMIPSPNVNESYVQEVHTSSPSPYGEVSKIGQSGETNELLTVDLTTKEEDCPKETKSTDNDLIPPPQNNNLIPSPQKDESVMNENILQGNNQTNDDVVIPSPSLGAMNLSVDSGIANMNNNLGVMNQSNEIASGIGPMNASVMNQNAGSTGLGLIMTQSSDGGIPTPEASKDEFDLW